MTAEAPEERAAAALLRQAIDARLERPTPPAPREVTGSGEVFVTFADPQSGFAAARLVERLASRFGWDSVYAADPRYSRHNLYPAEILARMQRSAVVLLVFEATSGDRKISQRTKHEIQIASGANIPVIPVLLGMSDEPFFVIDADHSQYLLQRPAVVGARTWRADTETLIQRLETHVATGRQHRGPVPRSTARQGSRLWSVFMALGLGGLSFGAPALLLEDSPLTARSVAISGLTLMLVPLLLALLISLSKPGLGTVQLRLKIACVAGALAAAFVATLITDNGTSWHILSLSLILGLPYIGYEVAMDLEERRRLALTWPQYLPEPIRPMNVHRHCQRWRQHWSQLQHPPSHGPVATELWTASLELLEKAKRGRLSWLLEDHPWLLVLYTAWGAGVAGLSMVAMDSFWLALTAIAVAGALGAATMELGYRYQRWLHRTVAAQVMAIVDIAARLD